VILARARPGAIGGAAIAAYLPEIEEGAGRGAWLELDPQTATRRVRAPIAPGLIQPLPIHSVRWLDVGQGGTLTQAPAVLALDGEREIAVHEGEALEIRLSQEGPHVVDVGAALRAASRAGVFVE
jgi:hypothetical protein